MKSHLTVDDALDQTVAAMNDGARPWTMGPAAAQRIRDAYRPDFEIQFRRPGAWERESGKVLRLARWAGAVAALLAETDAGPAPSPATCRRTMRSWAPWRRATPARSPPRRVAARSSRGAGATVPASERADRASAEGGHALHRGLRGRSVAPASPHRRVPCARRAAT